MRACIAAVVGGARWNVTAAYGAWRNNGKAHKQAVANLEKLFRHVTVQDKSARESLQTLVSGKGDVLLAYENEAALTRKNGQPVQFVIPRSTILIENPIAVLNSGIFAQIRRRVGGNTGG
jgi:ABC-type sulfate transport system substrate-binding protein